MFSWLGRDLMGWHEEVACHWVRSQGFGSSMANNDLCGNQELGMRSGRRKSVDLTSILVENGF